MGIEEGTCWDEHWVLHGNQFDNKFHILKKSSTLEVVGGGGWAGKKELDLKICLV